MIAERVVIKASYGRLSVIRVIGVIGVSRLKGDLTIDLGVGSSREID